jgi:hypothetical protein
MHADVVEKLKRKRGYNDGRIRLYPFDQSYWIAETYIPGRTAKKTWKVLREERSDKYKLFATPEQAAFALEDWINRFEQVEG